MTFEDIKQLQPILLYVTLPGGFGGLALFLYSLTQNRYMNDKLVRKVTLEVAGAMIVASFVSYNLFGQRPFLAFGIGTCWSAIVQLVRQRITAVVKAALGNGDES